MESPVALTATDSGGGWGQAPPAAHGLLTV